MQFQVQRDRPIAFCRDSVHELSPPQHLMGWKTRAPARDERISA
jgi:hypothetical protein